MGVTLERVQFKFASIIGELCSEPDVLSQFAVWLDLRLAEYKLKGAISLDCSGEEPDPIWLKGLNKPKKAVLSQTERQRGSPGLSRAQGTFSHRAAQLSPSRDLSIHADSVSGEERLSPDVVLVKEEPSDVYPVELHSHDGIDALPFGPRKRAAESISSSNDQWSRTVSPSLSKQKRFSATGESPTNQSLMSVLSGYQGDSQESSSKADNSGLTSAGVGSLSSPVASRTADTQIDVSMEYSDSTPTNSQSLRDIGWPGPSAVTGDSINETLGEEESNILMRSGFSSTLASCFVEKEKRIERLCRVNSIQAPRQSVLNMVTSVSTFENWLSKTSHNDHRPINQIPAAQLDPYLAEFFAKVTKESGEDYTRETFCSLRCHIQRFLIATNYGYSINKSPEFLQSQLAYKNRLYSLRKGKMPSKRKETREAKESNVLSDVTEIEALSHT